jgi:phage FluMu protein Com
LFRDSDLIWTCPRCSGTNFAVSTNQDIPVNALGPTHGRSFLERGRYTGVSITASGPWTIVPRPAPKMPARASYRFAGVDGQNLRPFTVTHVSDLLWSCPRCRNTNFAVTTNQDIPVNALGPTHGRSYLDRGRYTSVRVTASGPWVIVIREMGVPQ